MPVQHLSDDAGATAVADDVDHHLAVLEHPIRARTTIDAHARFIRAGHASAAQAREDAGHVGVEAQLAPAKGGVERALADPQAEQLQQQPA